MIRCHATVERSKINYKSFKKYLISSLSTVEEADALLLVRVESELINNLFMIIFFENIKVAYLHLVRCDVPWPRASGRWHVSGTEYLVSIPFRIMKLTIIYIEKIQWIQKSVLLY